MKYHYIKYELRGRTGYITLDRPEKRNALNEAMITELKEALGAAGEDRGAKIVVLKANGRVFSAGADLAYLKQLQKNSYRENLADSYHLMELFLQICHHKKLIIAQVEGHAIAGGCGLATVCDLCYAVPEAKFGYTEVQIGFIPALVSIFLTRKIGEGRARELLLTARLVNAAEAAGIGLITGLADKESIQEMVTEKADQLARTTSAQSIAQTKQLLSGIQGSGITDSLKLAAKMNAKARATEDCQKGIRAFLDKKKPGW